MKTDVLDPRPPAPDAALRPAPRLPDLAGAGVLLFDNGKLADGYGPRHVIFDVLRERLTAQATGVRLETRSEDLLLLDLAQVEALADEIAASGVDAVVLALVDAGVGMPTTVLAIALERRGVPTCTICEGPGLLMAAAVARPAPFLAFARLPVILGADAATVRAGTEAVAGDVITSLTGTTPLTAGAVEVRLPASRTGGTLSVEGDDPTAAFTALMADGGLGDGFPLLAPTPARVDVLLAGLDPDEEIWPVLPIRGSTVRARDVATLAAMAGVRPEWMPVVLAAYRGMAVTRFRLFQAAITTHPGGTLVVVSGPEAARLGIASGAGCLGPGNLANAAIGRAVALSFSFLLGSLPGGADLTIQGSPAEYAYCVGENLDASPWPGLHADLGVPDGTAVTVLRCEGPKNVLDHLSDTPEGLLTGVARAAATIHSNSAFFPGAETVVFLNPAHARMIARHGWSKQNVKEYLYANARNSRADLIGRGVAPVWPSQLDGVDPVPVALGPDGFVVVVAGAPGLASQVAVPWGLSRAVTIPL